MRPCSSRLARTRNDAISAPSSTATPSAKHSPAVADERADDVAERLLPAVAEERPQLVVSADDLESALDLEGRPDVERVFGEGRRRAFDVAAVDRVEVPVEGGLDHEELPSVVGGRGCGPTANEVRPPSTGRSTPVTKALASEPSQQTASPMSTGRPIRPSGSCAT